MLLFQSHGNVVNTGHGISLLLELGINEMVNISGGPLAYNYPIFDVSLHFGLRDEKGSEHTIDGKYFAGEVSSFNLKNQLLINVLVVAATNWLQC